MQNNKTKMVAGLSKKHLNKIISTIFTRDIELFLINKNTLYLKSC